MWAVTLTIGLLFVTLGGAGMTKVLSPGPVTLHHGEVGNCGTCHMKFAEGPGGWIHAAFAPTDTLAESKQCLACHEMGEEALRPHSLPRGVLANLTEEIKGRGNAANSVPLSLTVAHALFTVPDEAADSLACATCHKEHKGQDFDQTTMSNRRCQACHSVQFASLSDGHPEFELYPYMRRTRVNFDHVAHIARHFEKAGREKAPATCTDCHTPAENGRKMLVGTFARTCAACHLEQIEGIGQVGAKGISFLVVPGLDVIELKNRGAAIGEWPDWSEQKITPFMKVLLAREAGLVPDLERLESVDLLDLTEASDADIEAIERLAWAVKALIHDLIVSGVEELKIPFSNAFGQELDRIALSRLFGVVPLDVIRSAQGAWFPSLYREVAQYRQGVRVPMVGDSEAARLSPEAGESDVPQESDSPDSGDILAEAEGDILADEGDILADEGDILADEGDILADEGDILAEGEILTEQDESGMGIENKEPEKELRIAPPSDAEEWTTLGGWYRRDFALYYRPVGHADRFVRTWADLSGQTYGTSAEPPGSAVFATLTNKDAPGRCTKCHSVDREANGVLKVKWKPALPTPGERTATIFSHATHFSMLDDKGCLTCHALATKADYAGSYADNDPHSFASNFSRLEIGICADCHVPARAGNSCLLCHQYHVGTFRTRAVPTEMKMTAE